VTRRTVTCCWLAAVCAIAAMLALPPSAAGAPKIEKKTMVRSEPNVYSAELEIFEITRASAAQKRINDAIGDHARREIEEFAAMAHKSEARKPRPWALSGSYTVRYQSERWLSVLTGIAEDTGAAHPNHSISTWLFDMRTGAELPLGRLFKPDAPYLQLLSGICRKHLLARDDLKGDSRWVKTGTAPTQECFRAFVLDGRNLVVTFPPYQVGPYALGEVDVKIPYAELKAVASPDGPLLTP